jgi:hypothetical protein
LPSEKTLIEYKKENRILSISPIKKKTRIKFLMNITLEKVGDQELLETSMILRIFSTICTGPYPVKNVYKNGKIRIVQDQSRIECIQEWYNQNLKGSYPVKNV